MAKMETIFNGWVSCTYDDIIIHPRYIDFSLNEVDLSSNLTQNIRLQMPFLSSRMDTVTESEMAINMALHGGMGIIHNNNTLEKQVEEVSRVKRFRNGFITEPFVLSPDNTIADIDKIKQTYGFSGIPITDTGKLGGKLLGIVTNRDVDFLENRNILLGDIMTTDLVIGEQGCTLKETNKILVIFFCQLLLDYNSTIPHHLVVICTLGDIPTPPHTHPYQPTYHQA